MSIWRSIKNDGLRVSCAFALHKVTHALGLGSVQYYGFFVQNLGDRALPRAYSAHSIDTPGEVAKDLGLPEEIAVARRREGAHCIGIYYDAQLIGSMWFSALPFHEDEVDAIYDLDAREQRRFCWDFGVYVAPDWRASRAFAAVWAGGAHAMRDHGYTKSLSRISLFNRASVTAHQRLGAQEFARALFVNCGPMQLSVSNIRPWLHICWRGRRVPVFNMNRVIRNS